MEIQIGGANMSRDNSLKRSSEAGGHPVLAEGMICSPGRTGIVPAAERARWSLCQRAILIEQVVIE